MKEEDKEAMARCFMGSATLEGLERMMMDPARTQLWGVRGAA